MGFETFEVGRPFDLPYHLKGKKVIVGLKDYRILEGKLLTLDRNLNLVLDFTSEIIDEQLGKDKELGRVFLRGDAITFIKEAKNESQSKS